MTETVLIELPIKLVADPFGQAAVGQQFRCAADLIVEIDKPFASLGGIPGKREFLAKLENRGDPFGQLQQNLKIANLRHLLP